MILCIFEGGKREPRIFQTIKDLFFPKSKDTFICTYNSNNILVKLLYFDNIINYKR